MATYCSHILCQRSPHGETWFRDCWNGDILQGKYPLVTMPHHQCVKAVTENMEHVPKLETVCNLLIVCMHNLWNRRWKLNAADLSRDLDSSNHTTIILAEFLKTTRRNSTNDHIMDSTKSSVLLSSESYSDNTIVSLCCFTLSVNCIDETTSFIVHSTVMLLSTVTSHYLLRLIQYIRSRSAATAIFVVQSKMNIFPFRMAKYKQNLNSTKTVKNLAQIIIMN